MSDGEHFSGKEVYNFWSHFSGGIKFGELVRIGPDKLRSLADEPLIELGKTAVPDGTFEPYPLPAAPQSDLLVSTG